jgi:adenosylcobinamide-GDP ribazoletransferase
LCDAWRLALGTLTAIRVAPPARVTRATARGAMLLAPLAAIPLGILVATVTWAGRAADLAPLAVGFLAVGALAAGSRALHWDGVSDTADGLTASYDRERSLAVMKSGTAGPAGVVAVVVLVAVQAAALSWLVNSFRTAVVAGVLVCVSRCALTLTCMRGVPAARRDGLGVGYTETVGPVAATAGWLAAASACALAFGWAGLDWWRGLVAAGLAAAAVGVLLRRTTKRFGGVTGDVFGAGIEVALAVLLVSAT